MERNTNKSAKPPINQANQLNQPNQPQTPMFTYDHHTLRLFGYPVFALIVGAMFFTALAGLFYGIPRWAQLKGRITVITSTCVLLFFALAIALVCYTVWSGSMG